MSEFVGHYARGIGKAHLCGAEHVAAFGRPMVGTFNVRMPAGFDLRNYTPARTTRTDTGRSYWLVRLDGEHYAWALRWEGSRQSAETLELLTKSPLPANLKRHGLRVEILEPWGAEAVQAWARGHYQFQGFDWLPEKRVDSALVWRTIEPHARWSGARVLDVGSHYGYHAHRASGLGAEVTAFEPDAEVRACGLTINDHIQPDDVRFVAEDPGGTWEVILYLSVQHQWDPNYAALSETVEVYARRATQAVFVEVILPPLFGKRLTAGQVDEAISGSALVTYKHRIRGERRIYRVAGKAKEPT